jgi:ornithine cyclodeaminase/alanine dehydrogenase-like protein (mu-crystallin family)
MSLLLLNEDELRQIINYAEALGAIEDSFVALGEGRINIPGSFGMALPDVDGEVAVKGAYLQEAPYFVVQVTNSFANNPSINLPASSGILALFDAATGFPAALMVDNGYINHVRAGVVGALAAKYLANTPFDTVGVIGAGRQAFIQLKVLLTHRSVNLVKVWGRTPLEADSFARRIVEDHDVNITLAASVEEAVRNSDMLISATPSTKPLVEAGWLQPGMHITAVGSNAPNKQEYQAEVLGRADVIIVDDFDRAARLGEVHHGLDAGVITRRSVQGNLSQLMGGEIPGRTGREQITFVDLTGLDWQDMVIATLALDKALFLGLGQRLQHGLELRHLGQRVENLL